jgi:hypothetical protein
MRYLIRLQNKGEYSPADRKRLTSLAFETLRVFGMDVGNLRVSNLAVELDLLIDADCDVDGAVKILEREIGTLLTIRKLDVVGPSIEDAQAIRLGLDLFNEERYWESHEMLELVWRKATGAQKEVLQGIILLAAAFVHLQKNELDVTLSVMKRAHNKLDGHEGSYFGVDIGALKGKISRMISTARPDFFKIEAR